MNGNNGMQMIQPSEWQVMREQADVLVKSGLLPQTVKRPEQALAIILKGRELGIPAWAALTTINVIQGVPTVSPQLMVALIQRSGELENMVINGNAEQCAVMMERKGQESHTEVFTMDDAVKQQLANKQNWVRMPAVMLKWRAIAACARVVFPDVILGMYAPEEIAPDSDVDEDGMMVIDQPAKPKGITVKPSEHPQPEEAQQTMFADGRTFPRPSEEEVE